MAASNLVTDYQGEFMFEGNEDKNLIPLNKRQNERATKERNLCNWDCKRK